MNFKTEHLQFDSEYEFDVTVKYEREKYAGKLSLKTNSAHLVVFGDIGDGQQKFLPSNHIERLDCPDFNATITLFDIRFISGSSRTIDHNPRKSFCEYKYEVGSVLFSNTQFGDHSAFRGINIHSDTISKWLGNTRRQEEIIGLYQSRDLFHKNDNDLLEFSCDVFGVGFAGVAYNPKMFHSSPEFKAGISFPPSLFLMFTRELSAEQTLKLTNDLITFFKFITGGNVELSKIELLTVSGMFSKNATLFFPKPDSNKRKDEHIFFPLGKDLRFDQLKLPQLPTDALANFLLQNSRQSNLFNQYLKYREMNSNEEKFLGYFRLLETITYKKGRYLDEDVLLKVATSSKSFLVRKFGDKKSVTDFLKRIPKWNLSKYNAEKCIIDLHKNIPAEVSGKWRYSAKDVADICKLRNDITHANKYEASTITIFRYTKFIEVLMVYSLLVKIGISADSSAAILHRLKGYDALLKVNT